MAAKLAFDRQIEQCPISQAAALIEVETDFPNLLGFQSPLCTHGPSGIPNRAHGGGEFCFSHLHDRSPMATSAICKTLAEEDAKEWLWARADHVRTIPSPTPNGSSKRKPSFAFFRAGQHPRASSPSFSADARRLESGIPWWPTAQPP
ncbi:hypothetical protein MRBLMA1_002990 [Sphingobium sp. LMA1-1-1.1]